MTLDERIAAAIKARLTPDQLANVVEESRPYDDAPPDWEWIVSWLGDWLAQEIADEIMAKESA